MEVDSFSDIQEEFMTRIRKLVWCSAATIDRHNRPRSRVLHPVWEGPLGFGPAMIWKDGPDVPTQIWRGDSR